LTESRRCALQWREKDSVCKGPGDDLRVQFLLTDLQAELKEHVRVEWVKDVLGRKATIRFLQKAWSLVACIQRKGPFERHWRTCALQ